MSGGFRFIDEVDAQRQLGVDRLTFEELVRTKRLREVTPGFFRGTDVAKLRAELHPEVEAEDAEAALQPTDGSQLADGPQPADTPALAQTTNPPKKKGHEPAMRVHLRLTADLKWYDIGDADLRAWFDQLRPDAYERQRANARFVITRMEQILALIDEGERRLAEAGQQDDAGGNESSAGGGPSGSPEGPPPAPPSA